MREINGDLQVLAKVKKGGKEYEMRDVEYKVLEKFQERLDSGENTRDVYLDLLEQSGIPKEVSRGFSLRTLNELQNVLMEEYKTEKK